MSRTMQLYKDFVEAFQARDLMKVLSFLDPDINYYNIPGEPINGIEGTRYVLSQIIDMSSEIRWDLLNVAETPDGKILTEKVENYLIKGSWFALEVMTSLEFIDGKIRNWRAYYDGEKANAIARKVAGEAT